MRGLKSLSDPDRRIGLLFSILIVYYPIQCALNAVVNLFASGTWLDSAMIYAVIALAVVWALPVLVKRLNVGSVLLLLLAAMAFLVTIVFNLPGAEYAWSNALTAFMPAFLYIFVGCAVRNYRKLTEILYPLANFTTVSVGIWYMLLLAADDIEWANFMRIAYAYLPCILLGIFRFFQRRSIANGLWMGASLVLAVLLGTRGVILIALVYICWALLHFTRSGWTLVAAVVLVVIAVFVYTYFTEILLWADQLLKSIGITSGGIQKMLYAEDLSNGRFGKQAEALLLIQENPGGLGLYGDYARLGIYVHQLLLELLIDFGWVGGALAIAGVAIAAYSLLRASRSSSEMYAMSSSMFLCGIGKLMLSGSYLNEPLFFLFIGMALSGNIRPKRRRRL